MTNSSQPLHTSEFQACPASTQRPPRQAAHQNLCAAQPTTRTTASAAAAALPAYPMCGQWFSSIGHERVKPIDHANREYPRTSTICTSEDLDW